MSRARTRLPPLRKALAIQRNAPIVLPGHLPGEGLPERFDFTGLKLPRSLPVSLPSELVVQRPDVRAAEENMHALCLKRFFCRSRFFVVSSSGGQIRNGARGKQMRPLVLAVERE